MHAVVHGSVAIFEKRALCDLLLALGTYTHSTRASARPKHVPYTSYTGRY